MTVWDELGWTDPDRREEAIDRLLARLEIEEPLSPTEVKITAALSHGMGEKGAAEIYGVSYQTVRTHSQRARRKMRAKNNVHLVAICLRRGVID